MTTDELIKRINELSAIARTRDLTDEETKERTELRAEYVRRFRESMTAGLDTIYYVGDDGKEHKLRRRDEEKTDKEEHNE